MPPDFVCQVFLWGKGLDIVIPPVAVGEELSEEFDRGGIAFRGVLCRYIDCERM